MFILSHTHHLTHLIWNEHTATLIDNSIPVHCFLMAAITACLSQTMKLGAGETGQHACSVTVFTLVLCCICRAVATNQ